MKHLIVVAGMAAGLAASAAAQSTHLANLVALNTATRDGRMRVDIQAGGEGRAALRHGIELTFKLFGLHDFLNPDSGLIERERQHRALHLDVDPTPVWIETVFSDWRPVAGVLYPRRRVEREVGTGQVLATVTTRAIRLNTSPPDQRFETP